MFEERQFGECFAVLLQIRLKISSLQRVILSLIYGGKRLKKEESRMINDGEKKLIRKYCLLPVVAKACLAMALLIGFVWIPLVMIDNMVFNGNSYMLGLYIYLGIAAVYTIAFTVCFLIPRIGMRKEKWQKITEKANIELSDKDYSAQIALTLGAKATGHLFKMRGNSHGKVFDALAGVGALITVTQMTNELHKNAKLVAIVCGVEIPKARKYIVSIFLLPILLLIAVYIPQFILSKQNADAGIALASKSVYALEASFKQDCDHVYIDDPQEGYKDYGYRVTGYLYSWEEPYNSYISVTVENDGLIREVIYCVDIDIQAEKEENLKKAELDLLKLNVMMNDSHVKAASYDLLEEYSLPEEFISRFQNISYYENLRFQKDDQVSIHYTTEPEEEYDEDSESYIYFIIEGKAR